MAPSKRRSRPYSDPAVLIDLTGDDDDDDDESSRKERPEQEDLPERGSWVYRAFRAVFEASHRDTTPTPLAVGSLSPEEADQGLDESNSNNIQQVETDSEMTTSSGEHVATADEHSLPLPMAAPSASVPTTTTRRDISDGEISTSRSDHTSMDDSRSSRQSREGTAESKFVSSKGEGERTQKTKPAANGISVHARNREKGSKEIEIVDLTSDGEESVAEVIGGNQPTMNLRQLLPKQPSPATDLKNAAEEPKWLQRPLPKYGSTSAVEPQGRQRPLPKYGATNHAHYASAQSSRTGTMAVSAFASSPSASQIKKAPSYSLSASRNLKAPPVALAQTQLAFASSDNQLLNHRKAFDSLEASVEDDRKPAAVPNRSLANLQVDGMLSPTKNRKRSPDSAFPFGVFASGPPLQIEFKKSPLSLPLSPTKKSHPLSSTRKKFHGDPLQFYQGQGVNAIDSRKATQKRRRGLIHKTCREGLPRPEVVGDVQRTIPPKDPAYFALSSQKKIFQVALLSKESAMMLAQKSFAIKGEINTNMRDLRSVIDDIVEGCLGQGVTWEFFLPDSGAFIKRELEPMILLSEYMDECNFGRQISVRVVADHSPAIVQLMHSIEAM